MFSNTLHGTPWINLEHVSENGVIFWVEIVRISRDIPPKPLSRSATERPAPGSSVETTPGDAEPGLAAGSDEVGQ